MLLYQCGIFVVLFGLFISFELPHGKDGPHGAVSEANLQLGQERAKNNQAIEVELEAKGDSDGFEFKKEIQVPIKIYKPPSVNNENDDGVIKRVKRKSAKVSRKKGHEKNKKMLFVGIGVTIIVVTLCICCFVLMKTG